MILHRRPVVGFGRLDFSVVRKSLIFKAFFAKLSSTYGDNYVL
jgi:hypothetical protein